MMMTRLGMWLGLGVVLLGLVLWGGTRPVDGEDGPAAEGVGMTCVSAQVCQHVRGVSGWVVDPKTAAFTAVSDFGRVLEGHLTLDATGQVTRAEARRVFDLKGPDGRDLTCTDRWWDNKTWCDAEALVHLHTGHWLVAFERNARLLYYSNWRRRAVPAPPGYPTHLPDALKTCGNECIEALTEVAPGKLLAIRERAGMPFPRQCDDLHPTTYQAWLWDGHQWIAKPYQGHLEFWPSDATTLPDGRVLVLERCLSRVLPERFETRVRELSGVNLLTQLFAQPKILNLDVKSINQDNFEGLSWYQLKLKWYSLVLVSDTPGGQGCGNKAPCIRSVE